MKGPYQATFAGTTVILKDPTADVDSGDYVTRALSSGKAERSYIQNATFYDVGIGGIAPHFQLKIGTPPHFSRARTPSKLATTTLRTS